MIYIPENTGKITSAFLTKPQMYGNAVAWQEESCEYYVTGAL